MKLGISSTCIWKLCPTEAIDFAEKLGLCSFELWADHYFYYKESIKDIRHAYRETGLTPTVHAASWDLNITSASKHTREFSIEQVKKSINLAAGIGARIITIHPGRKSFFRAEPEEIAKLQREVFHDFFQYSQGKGLLLCIENIEKTGKDVMVSEYDFLDFLSGINDELYITMDLAHLGSFEKVKSFYAALGKKVKHIHISDLDPDEIHLPMGKGVLETKNILSHLNHSYRGIYSLEFYDGDAGGKKAKQSIDYLKKFE